MALKGTSNEEKIWNYLKDKGLPDFGIAGLMGNLYAESGLRPNNLQNSYEKKLGMSDETYTQEVDNGSYANFVKDSAGYGLAQWTYWSRKQNLLEFVRANEKSVGDLEVQLEFLFHELSTGYKSVWSALKTATSIIVASNAVLLQYERPADQSETVQKKRAGYGQEIYNRQAGGNTMKTRQAVIALAKSWIGKKESDGSHKSIIDIYNSYKPHPRGYALKYTDAWCAGTVSALAIKLGYTDIIPVECSCGKMIELAKNMGIWVENDAYVPKTADFILYDWDDNGIGDNTGNPDHIGTVESVAGNTITVIEGNYSNSVKRRTLQVNGKYIRGYITPKYDADGETKKPEGKKSVAEVAKEILNGVWGNGADRKARLEAAGYNYSEVQAEVNRLVDGGSAKKSNTEIAKEVIQGKWGNGADRKNRLTAAGYDYAAVQKEVNKLC